MTLKQVFDSLWEAKVKYVVLNDWRGLPFDPPRKLEILAGNERVFQNITHLTRVNGCRYILKLTDEAVDVMLFGKGKGLYPERFETAMLETSVLHHDCVSVCSNINDYWQNMYRWLHHDDLFKDTHDYSVVRQMIDDRVGQPVPCEYKEIEIKKH